MANYMFSFSQGFGGAEFILSYPLAKAVAADMENCLRRYRHLNAADKTTMSCVADFGVSLRRSTEFISGPLTLAVVLLFTVEMASLGVVQVLPLCLLTGA